MRTILQNRGLRLMFIANVISMIGSGLNSAGVTWYLLQVTHSEMALGTLVMLQTIPALFMLPFTGVIIDRRDRRHLVMALDAARGLVVLAIAILAWRGLAQLWQVYLMGVLVAAGFWMFWPTITALIQEMTPESRFTQSNSFLLAGFQGGWLIAGAVVGFTYNHIGLSGVLFIDFLSYALSFSLYLFVRRGRHTVAVPSKIKHESEVARFLHELREGIAYIKLRPALLLVGTSWSLFLGGMLSQGIITAPLSDRILNAGAVGYGWLNSGWGTGAFFGSFATPALIHGHGHRRAIAVATALMGISLIALPFVGTHLHGSIHFNAAFAVGTAMLASVAVYGVMGVCRALGGVAINSSMMEQVPKHFMGRVQNTFFFAGTVLQLVLSFVVGTVAHNRGLTEAFAIVGAVYLVASLTGGWPVKASAPVETARVEADAAS
jgi:MFS family permease